MLTGLSAIRLNNNYNQIHDMTVALQTCGIVALTFIGLLVIMAFLDAHGWFNAPTRTTSTPYFIRLSTLRTEMNYWGANTLMELREAVSLNLNRQVEFVDDVVRCAPEDAEYYHLIASVEKSQGLDIDTIKEFLKEAGR